MKTIRWNWRVLMDRLFLLLALVAAGLSLGRLGVTVSEVGFHAEDLPDLVVGLALLILASEHLHRMFRGEEIV